MIDNLKIKNLILLISAGMMEITWMYLLSSILFLMLNAPVFSIWLTVLAFFIPMLLTYILNGRGKRVWEYVLIHLIFYLIILLYVIYSYGNQAEPFLNFNWLHMIFSLQYGSLNGFTYFIILCWFSFLWINGNNIVNRSNEYSVITARFDLGIAALVFGFIIMASTKISIPNARTLIIYYFLFSMFTIVFARNFKIINTNYSSKTQVSGTSLVLTFILMVLLIGSWIVLFFLPQLTSAAQTGYHVIKIIARPIGNFLLKILMFLFGYGNPTGSTNSNFPGESGMPLMEKTEPSWFTQLLADIVTWGSIILLIMIALIAFIWLLFSLWKWFSKKTDLESGKKGFFEELFLWFSQLIHIAVNVFNKLFIYIKNMKNKNDNILTIFNKLCKWGRNSGIPRKKSITPQEFGKELIYFFPDSKDNIELIINSFNQMIYGKESIDDKQIKKVKRAWKHLSSPSYWPSRFLVKVFYSRKYDPKETVTYT